MTYLAQFYHKFNEQDPDSGFSSQVWFWTLTVPMGAQLQSFRIHHRSHHNHNHNLHFHNDSNQACSSGEEDSPLRRPVALRQGAMARSTSNWVEDDDYIWYCWSLLNSSFSLFHLKRTRPVSWHGRGRLEVTFTFLGGTKVLGAAALDTHGAGKPVPSCGNERRRRGLNTVN